MGKFYLLKMDFLFCISKWKKNILKKNKKKIEILPVSKIKNRNIPKVSIFHLEPWIGQT